MTVAGRQRGGAFFDAILFQLVIALIGVLLLSTTMLPNRRRAERVEAEVVHTEVEVRAAAERIAKLKAEVWALQSDPAYIERVLRRKTRELKPHRVEPPAPLTGDVPDGASTGELTGG